MKPTQQVPYYLTTVIRPGGISTSEKTSLKKCIQVDVYTGEEDGWWEMLLLGNEGVGNGLHPVHRTYQHHSSASEHETETSIKPGNS